MKVKPWALATAICLLIVPLTSCGKALPPTSEVTGPESTGLPSEPGPTSDESPLALRQPDGGSDYFVQFKDSLPSNESFFPLGVWLESVVDPADLARDAELGLNTYVDVTENSVPELLAGSDAQVISSWDVPGRKGAVLADEVDMWAGPGDAPWTGAWPGQGSVCAPAEERCGYSVQSKLVASVPKGMLRYTNYGKGVTFWETTEEASRFVNEFQDVVSADNYWFTDPHICVESQGGAVLELPRQLTPDECRRASNYGWTVERVRELVDPLGSKPVWSFVEVGHPFTEEDSPTITEPQIRAAVWSSIIHGARGIVYFNHSFNGTCQSHHVLRDCGAKLRTAVASLNQQITELAPVLNAPFLDGSVKSSAPIDASVKVYKGDLYVLAAAAESGVPQASFDLQCALDGKVEVLGEDRTVSVQDGHFSDAFDDSNSVHIYQLKGNDCGF